MRPPPSSSRAEPAYEARGEGGAGPRSEGRGSATRGAAPAAVAERVASPESGGRRTASPQSPAASPVGLDINALVARWDDILAAVRRERPIVGTLLERAMPTAVAASGLVSLHVEEMGAFESLAARTKELTTALAQHITGLARVQLLPPESAKEAGPRRMTAESIKSETLQALRKRDAVLAAAIDELDLDLVD